MAENLDVITVGETMVLGVPPRPGRLRHATSLELKIGGAESNLAIALSRLGLSAGWAGYRRTSRRSWPGPATTPTPVMMTSSAVTMPRVASLPIFWK